MGRLILLATAFFLLSASFFTHFASNADRSVREEAPAFAIEGLPDGIPIHRDIVLVNFFASWCIPCEAEHSALMSLSKTMPIYGIAFMDSEKQVGAFLEKHGNPYTSIGYDAGAKAAAAWKVESVPTSFVVANGIILLRIDQPLTDDLIQRSIKPLLASATEE